MDETLKGIYRAFLKYPGQMLLGECIFHKDNNIVEINLLYFEKGKWKNSYESDHYHHHILLTPEKAIHSGNFVENEMWTHT